MIESVYLVLLIAALWLSKRSLFDPAPDEDRLVAAAIGFGVWGAVTFASFGVEVHSGGAVEILTLETLAWIGFVALLIHLTVAMRLTVGLLANGDDP